VCLRLEANSPRLRHPITRDAAESLRGMGTRLAESWWM
jgi:hypothetical protein